MKVEKLIEKLKTLPKNLEVYLSHDSEGNNYGTIDEQSIELNIERDGTHKFIIIYPYEEYIDYEDLK